MIPKHKLTILVLILGLTAVVRTATADPASRVAEFLSEGDSQLAMEDVGAALEAYESAMGVAAKWVKSDPRDVERTFLLSQCLQKVGDAKIASGDFSEGWVAYDKSIALKRDALRRDPANSSYFGEMIESLCWIGDMKQGTNNIEGAIPAFEEAAAMLRQQSEQESGNLVPLRDLAVCLNRIATLNSAANEPLAALETAEESLIISRRLVKEAPESIEIYGYLTDSLSSIRRVKAEVGDSVGALAAYNEGLEIRRKLAANDPDQVELQIGLLKYLAQSSTIPSETEEQRAGVVRQLKEALSIASRLADQGELSDEQSAWPRQIEQMLSEAESLEFAVENSDRLQVLVLAFNAISPHGENWELFIQEEGGEDAGSGLLNSWKLDRFMGLPTTHGADMQLISTFNKHKEMRLIIKSHDKNDGIQNRKEFGIPDIFKGAKEILVKPSEKEREYLIYAVKSDGTKSEAIVALGDK